MVFSWTAVHCYSCGYLNVFSTQELEWCRRGVQEGRGRWMTICNCTILDAGPSLFYSSIRGKKEAIHSELIRFVLVLDLVSFWISARDAPCNGHWQTRPVNTPDISSSICIMPAFAAPNWRRVEVGSYYSFRYADDSFSSITFLTLQDQSPKIWSLGSLLSVNVHLTKRNRKEQ